MTKRKLKYRAVYTKRLGACVTEELYKAVMKAANSKDMPKHKRGYLGVVVRERLEQAFGILPAEPAISEEQKLLEALTRTAKQ